MSDSIREHRKKKIRDVFTKKRLKAIVAIGRVIDNGFSCLSGIEKWMDYELRWIHLAMGPSEELRPEIESIIDLLSDAPKTPPRREYAALTVSDHARPPREDWLNDLLTERGRIALGESEHGYQAFRIKSTPENPLDQTFLIVRANPPQKLDEKLDRS